MKKFLNNLFRKKNSAKEEIVPKAEKELEKEVKKDKGKEIKNNKNSNLKKEKEEKIKVDQFKKTLNYFNLPPDATKEDLKNKIEKTNEKYVPYKDRKIRELKRKENSKRMKREYQESIKEIRKKKAKEEENIKKNYKISKPKLNVENGNKLVVKKRSSLKNKKKNQAIKLNKKNKVVVYKPVTVIKSISARTFWGEEGTEPPQYFMNYDEMRVNPMDPGYAVLLDNTKIFTLQLFQGGFYSSKYDNKDIDTDFGRSERYMDQWEATEHILYKKCPDLKSIWKVSMCSKRTGRFCYAKTKKDLMKLICAGNPSWYYIEWFDQFTKESEARWQRYLKKRRKEWKEREREAWANAKTFNFEFDPSAYQNYQGTRFDFEKDLGNKDCYQILGVTRKVSQVDLKRAYWELAKRYHPDLNQNDNDAEEKFKEINNAYEILSDPIKKRYV